MTGLMLKRRSSVQKAFLTLWTLNILFTFYFLALSQVSTHRLLGVHQQVWKLMLTSQPKVIHLHLRILVGKVKIQISNSSPSSLMVPAFSFIAGCWFGNPRHPDLRTWMEGVSSADPLREEKHAEAHSLALGLSDLVFTKHEQARNIVTKPQRKDICTVLKKYKDGKGLWKSLIISAETKERRNKKHKEVLRSHSKHSSWIHRMTCTFLFPQLFWYWVQCYFTVAAWMFCWTIASSIELLYIALG